ncbi:hypothetical protein CUMW_062780 [Citrus unshiu]|nr:hypothetical protein CUMW_062780 [Citrus unshiu]
MTRNKRDWDWSLSGWAKTFRLATLASTGIGRCLAPTIRLPCQHCEFLPIATERPEKLAHVLYIPL